MPRWGNAVPPGSRRFKDLREAGAAMLVPMRTTDDTERIAVPCSVQPPLKKSRPSTLHFDAYGADYNDRTSTQDRSRTWNPLRRQSASKESCLDDDIFSASSGHYYSWAAPRTPGETCSTLSLGRDCAIAPIDADGYYGRKVTRSDLEHLSLSNDYFAQYEGPDSEGLIANDFVEEGHCDTNSQSYPTSIGLDHAGRNGKNDASCFDSYTSLYDCSSQFMDQSLSSRCDNDSHTTLAYPLSVYQNSVGGETSSTNQFWYPASSEGSDSCHVRNFENTSGAIKSDTLYPSSNTHSTTEGCNDQLGVCANASVSVRNAAADENSFSYANSAQTSALCVPLAQHKNHTLDSSARSHMYVPNGFVLSSLGSYNASAYGGKLPSNNGGSCTQLYPSCGPILYFVPNNLGTFKPMAHVSDTNATNGERSNHIACGGFYQKTTDQSPSTLTGQCVDGTVETNQYNQGTASYDSSRTVTKECSASVFLTNTSGADSFERSYSDRSAADFNEHIRMPVNNQLNNYQTVQCSSDMAYGANGFCVMVADSSPHGATVYREPKQLSASDESTNVGVYKCPTNSLVHTTAPDFVPETVERDIHCVQQTEGCHGDTQLSTCRLSDSNTFACSNAPVACNTFVLPGTADQNANFFQEGAAYYDQAQVSASNHMRYVELNGGSDEVYVSGTEFVPQNTETLSSSQSTAVVAAPVLVNGFGETSDGDKEASPGAAQQCGDRNSGLAVTAETGDTTSAAKAATTESGSEPTDIPWEIGPQACPTGYSAQLKSLATHVAIAASMPRREKLKWPLPIPLLMRPRDKELTFRDIEYNWLSQCVFFVAQEEVHAQTLDEKGWLRIFAKSPRAAHNLVQTQALAGILVKCTVVNSYTDSLGYVRNVPRRYTNTALFEMLQDEGVICAQRQTGFMRYESGAVGDVATGTVLLTFLPDRRIPRTVNIGLISYEVTRRLTLPLQCYNCQRFGHLAKECKLPISCRLCAGTHTYLQCTSRDKPQCVNCGEAHPSTYWRCPMRLAQASSEPRNWWLEDCVKE
ncbi:uncharacterized protein LOC142557251 isoform X2 [Dermacentor variabilis]|uniref:uncharacterized protein LOC142557251 isoform X2 n=1 Tax=Dermacentor variabilis TaxID=34621 RepID=UPI003F5B9FC3